MPVGPNRDIGLPQALADALRSFTGPENPPVNMALQGLGYMTGPENPPVHMLLQALNRADPAGLAGGPLPGGLAMAKIVKGPPFKAAGFREKASGKIVGTGASHDIASVPGWSAAGWEDGFIGHDGKFFTREQAADFVNNRRGSLSSEAVPWSREAIVDENKQVRMGGPGFGSPEAQKEAPLRTGSPAVQTEAAKQLREGPREVVAASKLTTKEEAFAALDRATKSWRDFQYKAGLTGKVNGRAREQLRKQVEAYADRASELAGFKVHPDW